MDGQLTVLSTSMEDNVSINSSDSVTTSGEYEIVPELIDCGAEAGSLDSNTKPPTQSPKLAIFNNGDMAELAKNMHEVIHDMDDTFVGRRESSDSEGGDMAKHTVASSCLAPETVVMDTNAMRLAGQGKRKLLVQLLYFQQHLCFVSRMCYHQCDKLFINIVCVELK